MLQERGVLYGAVLKKSKKHRAIMHFELRGSLRLFYYPDRSCSDAYEHPWFPMISGLSFFWRKWNLRKHSVLSMPKGPPKNACPMSLGHPRISDCKSLDVLSTFLSQLRPKRLLLRHFLERCFRSERFRRSCHQKVEKSSSDMHFEPLLGGL